MYGIDLNEDDFVLQYRDTDKNGDADTLYPKIAYWVTDSPIRVGNTMQATASVIQRKFAPDEGWTYLPAVKISSPLVSLSEGGSSYDTDPYAGEGEVVLPEEDYFEDAIDAILEALDGLIRKYGL